MFYHLNTALLESEMRAYDVALHVHIIEESLASLMNIKNVLWYSESIL